MIAVAFRWWATTRAALALAIFHPSIHSFMTTRFLLGFTSGAVGLFLERARVIGGTRARSPFPSEGGSLLANDFGEFEYPDEGHYDPRKEVPDVERIHPATFVAFIDTEFIRRKLNDFAALDIDQDAANAMNAADGMSATLDALDELFELVSYLPQVCAELERMYRLTRTDRLRYANLRAACMAAFSASADGDPDALSYVRDEIAGDGFGWGR